MLHSLFRKQRRREKVNIMGYYRKQKGSNPMTKTERIAYLNDLCRTAPGLGGKWVMTPGIAALDWRVQSRIRERVETYSDFTEESDPWHERDFGHFTESGVSVFWKIAYYDASSDYTYGSDDPSHPQTTARVLTIMLKEEY